MAEQQKGNFKRMLLNICEGLFYTDEEEIVADNKDEETEKYFAYLSFRFTEEGILQLQFNYNFFFVVQCYVFVVVVQH